ncbi:Fe-S-containing hydro-lyase [Wukongibacter baidiensis]|uniref:Fe-S-containing hydro-lyase n=1 Tax=Wukongibacter baidiensis TaxID=1723361 RepID=UPI003D7F7FA7
MIKRIRTPLTLEKIRSLKAGDNVLLTGTIYTARDAAHKRLVELIEKNEDLPIDLRNQVIYYVGPSPAKEGQPIGSAGPTTSYRMDPYTPALLEKGLRGMIGKGLRNKEVIESIVENKGIYFAAIGGAAALIAKCVKAAEIVTYEDLGAEAIRKLYVEDFPLVVVVDCEGNDYYDIGQREYLDMLRGGIVEDK